MDGMDSYAYKAGNIQREKRVGSESKKEKVIEAEYEYVLVV